jgi:hypothetical protein
MTGHVISFDINSLAHFSALMTVHGRGVAGHGHGSATAWS